MNKRMKATKKIKDQCLIINTKKHQIGYSLLENKIIYLKNKNLEHLKLDLYKSKYLDYEIILEFKEPVLKSILIFKDLSTNELLILDTLNKIKKLDKKIILELMTETKDLKEKLILRKVGEYF